MNKKQRSLQHVTSLLRGAHQRERLSVRGDAGTEVQILHPNISVSKPLS